MKKLLFALLLVSVTLPLSVLADLQLPVQADSPAFVSLTNIPALQGAGNADTLPTFVNSLYRIAIGLAAVLAVLQIIRAGIMYMGGDSVTEKKEAKNLIALSIGGLILILSPVVVFSIINPSILDLKIGRLSELKTPPPPPSTPGGSVVGGTTTSGACSVYKSLGSAPSSPGCNVAGGYEVAPNSCCTGLTAGKICCGSKTATAPAPPTSSTPASCQATYSFVTPSTSCGAGFASAPTNCCPALSSGQICCGKAKTTTTTAPPTTLPPTPTTLKWGWRGDLSNNSTHGIATFQQGPFTTQQLCSTSLGEWPQKHNYSQTGDYECNCNTDLSKQPGCAAKFNL